MANGYIGKIINVSLTDGNIVEEALGEDLCRDYIGVTALALDCYMNAYRSELIH
jgi:aldehyde:ferredoxin oxidoreductase